MPAYAACIAAWKGANQIHPLGDTPASNQRASKTDKASRKSVSAFRNAATDHDFPIKASAEMASGAHDIVNRAQTSVQATAASLVAASSMARNIRVPAYCVRTRGGFVGCTSSPHTLTTHGRPEFFSTGHALYALVAVLEVCLAVVVVVGITTFNGWVAAVALCGGLVGHSLTHWQAVAVVELKEST